MGGSLPKSGRDDRRSNPASFYRTLKPLLSYWGSTAFAATRGMVYLTPFEIQQRGTLNKMYQVQNNNVGTLRYTIYADNGLTPAGGSRLFDTGNIGVALYTTSTFNYAIDPGIYWLAVTYSTSAGAPWRGSGNFPAAWSVATFSYRAGSLASNTIIPPTPCPAVTLGGNAAIVWIATLV